MFPRPLAFACALAVLAPAADAAVTVSGAVSQRPDEIVVRLTPSASAAARATRAPAGARLSRSGSAAFDAAVAAMPGAWCEREFPEPAASARGTRAAAGADALAPFWIVHVPHGTDVSRAGAALRASGVVLDASPVALVPVAALPNDSLFAANYGLYQPSRHDVHAVEAWDLTTGDTSVVVAILDTGVLLDHPDLQHQLWTNVAEATGQPGVDDDGNGYVDDVHGWDFLALDNANDVVAGEDWADEDDDPNDFVGHGTAVAGLVAAETDNLIGVASLAPNVRVMPVRCGFSAISQPAGLIDMGAAARGMVYAVRNGASVINCSFAADGKEDFAAALDVARQAGVVVVGAAGNGGPELYLPTREDVLAVAATRATDEVTPWSSTNLDVDLAAPGELLPTTTLTHAGTDSVSLRTPAYTIGASGTSFSAPFVSAAAALVQSYRHQHGLPPMAPMDLVLRLIDTADDIGAINPGRTGYGSGRLNVARALTDPATSFTIPGLAATVGAGVVLPGATGRRMVFATADAHLVFADGVPGDPVTSVALPAPPASGIAAADLGGGHGMGLFLALTDRTIAGYDANGAPLAGWPVQAGAPAGTGSQVPCPAIGDVDGDGLAEVLWGGDGALHAWHADGSRVNGFPQWLPNGPDGALHVALANLDGRAGFEIIAANDGGAVRVLGLVANFVDDWAVTGSLVSEPIVAFQGPSRRARIILSTGMRVGAYTVHGSRVWAYDFAAQAGGALAAADLAGDGGQEVIATSPLTGELVAIDSTGHAFLHVAMTPALAVQAGDWPLVGSVGPGGRSAIVIRDFANHLRAYGSNGGVIETFPRPGAAGASPTIDDLDGDGHTQVVAGTGFEGLVYVYDAGPGTWNAAANLWPTARGGMARTGSTPGLHALMPEDLSPPLAVRDLAAAPLDDSHVRLAWTAPADPDPAEPVARYEIRWALVPFPGGDLSIGSIVPPPTPSIPGARDSVLVSGLPLGATVSFALASYDAAGNPSATSNVVTLAMPTPGTVNDLAATPLDDHHAHLEWTVPSDPAVIGPVTRYEIRWSGVPVTPANFAAGTLVAPPVPSAAGARDSVQAGGLPEGRTAYVGMRAGDAGPGLGALSNVVTLVMPSVPPAPVSTLAAAGGTDSTLAFAWSATGDDGMQGRAAHYLLRAVAGAMSAAAFDTTSLATDVTGTQDAGGPEAGAIAGVVPGRPYEVATVAVDSIGNRSPLSNLVTATLPDTLPPAAVMDLVAVQLAPRRARVTWTAPADRPRHGIVTRYDLRWSGAPMTEPGFAAATQVPVPLPPAPGSPCTTVATGLPEGGTVHFALRSYDLVGNASPISDVGSVFLPAVPPSAVTSLYLSSLQHTAVTLAWLASGEDGLNGRASRYLLRGALGTMDSATFDTTTLATLVPGTRDAGGLESGTLTGLVPGLRYAFAVMAVDSEGNRSRLSNVVTVRAGSTRADRDGAYVGSLQQPARAPVVIAWNGSGGPRESPSIELFDVRGRRVRKHPAAASGGTVTWDANDERGARAAPGLYFVRLRTVSGTARGRIVLLE